MSRVDEWMAVLVDGEDMAISGLPTSTGDSAGVFTIWYRGQLVHFGHASDTGETKPSNSKQADGVRGRIRGVARQPGRPLQRRLQSRFPEDWNRSTEASDIKRASDLLKSRGRCRVLRFTSGAEARDALATVELSLLTRRGE